jgi:hypothetical protein
MSSELETIISQAQKLDLPSQAQLISRLTKDAVVNPWLAIAGSLVDDPLFDDYVAEIDRYRQETVSKISCVSISGFLLP